MLSISPKIEKLMKSAALRFIDFINKLIYRPPGSEIDLDCLLIQQESLKKIWDHPEEDRYNLNE